MDEPGPAVPVDGLRAIFDEDAALYDRARPGYPAELLADLRSFAGLGPGATIIEIGPGTGQATLPLVASGAAVTAVELGPSMAARLRDNVARAGAVGVAGAGVVDVVVAAFEDWPLPGRLFDAVVAFTAWHWLDPDVRTAKVAAALRPGGVLATVTTLHVDNDQDQFSADVQACYDRWDPATTPGFRPPSAAEAPPVLDEVDASELFEPGVRRRFTADVVYSAAAYVDVLHTYSNHRALSPEQREGLFACIRRLITEAYGDRVTKRYLYELRLARRR
jgi:SAM-dependent methyltransferase